MNNDERKKIAQRLSTRVETGLHFIEFEYLARHSTPDLAWIRIIYILFSFYSELLLKAVFVMRGDFRNLSSLEEKLKRMAHDLKEISRQISKDSLLEFGIKDISFTNGEYLIETDSGNFSVKDFTDIRYDFLDKRIRTIYGNEHDLFKEQIEIMQKINHKLKPLVW